jgi:hypothetical protein
MMGIEACGVRTEELNLADKQKPKLRFRYGLAGICFAAGLAAWAITIWISSAPVPAAFVGIAVMSLVAGFGNVVTR